MTKQQLVLAFDTASDAIALAVGSMLDQTEQSHPKGSGLVLHALASGDMMARREANVQLVPAIDRLFASNGFDKSDLACVVCGRGPGSFTGVRIAVATAKGLAAGSEVPLVGVATPDAIAWQCWLDGTRGHIAVLLDAMRGEVYPARYSLDEQGATREDPLTVIKADELAQKWQSYSNELLLTGDALYKYGKLFEEFTCLDQQYWHPLGTGLLKAFEAELKNDLVLAALLEDILKWGNAPSTEAAIVQSETRSALIATRIAGLLPVYTRLSDAEENERRRLAEGGAIAQGALTEVPASGVAWPLQVGKRVFRPAAKGDVTSMAALEQLAYAHDAGNPAGECWTETLIATEIGRSDRSWWVCYLDEVLAGFIGGQLVDGQMHVLDVVVHESYRRQGIAHELLTLLARDAKDLGATELTLEVRASNAAAQTLYATRGLEEVGRRKGYYSPLKQGASREDAVIMTGNIDKALGSLPQESRVEQSVLEDYALSAPASPVPHILAIESSCDETAAALIDGDGQLLSNVVASQTDFHARFGGVVPEIASRKHTEAIYPVVMEAKGAYCWHDLDAIAVTYAPGLIGALVVGVAFAKGLCWATGLPLIKVNHLEGHVYANRFVESKQPKQNQDSSQKQDSLYKIDPQHIEPPFVIALLSGGNTLLVHVKQWGSYQVLGETLDDAIGEAYDKVAKALGLGYPGGPVIARLAEEGNPRAVDFPRALLHSHDYRFSFSGLKTAVLTVIREQEAAGTLNLADIAASFEQAVIDVQVAKAVTACKSLGVTTFCIGGGVAANKALRAAYKNAMESKGIRVVFPPAVACTDNAAMIAAVALDRFRQDRFAGLESDAAAHADLEEAY